MPVVVSTAVTAVDYPGLPPGHARVPTSTAGSSSQVAGATGSPRRIRSRAPNAARNASSGRATDPLPPRTETMAPSGVALVDDRFTGRAVAGSVDHPQRVVVDDGQPLARRQRVVDRSAPARCSRPPSATTSNEPHSVVKRPVYRAGSATGPSSGVAVEALLGQPDEPHGQRRRRLGGAVDRVGEDADREAIDGIEPRVGDEAGEAPAVAEHPPPAEVGDLEAEGVLAARLDIPLGVLHRPLGVVGEDPLVAEEVGRRPSHDVAGRRREPRRGGHRAGGDVVDRDALGGVAERRVPGGVIAGGERIDVGRGRREAERLEQGRPARARRRARRWPPRSTAPSNEKPMLEYLKRSLRASTAPSSTAMRAQRGGVGEGPHELPVVAVAAVADEPATVGEQLAQRDPGDRRRRQRRQPLPHRVVEAQHAALGEAHDRRGGERLGVRGDAEAVVRRQRRRRPRRRRARGPSPGRCRRRAARRPGCPGIRSRRCR